MAKLLNEQFHFLSIVSTNKIFLFFQNVYPANIIFLFSPHQPHSFFLHDINSILYVICLYYLIHYFSWITTSQFFILIFILLPKKCSIILINYFTDAISQNECHHSISPFYFSFNEHFILFKYY